MNADWRMPNDVKKSYVNASILKVNRIVFNIKGNSYRLMIKFNFEQQLAFIRKSRVSEILNRKRGLTVEMIRKLAARLNL